MSQRPGSQRVTWSVESVEDDYLWFGTTYRGEFICSASQLLASCHSANFGPWHTITVIICETN